MMKWNDPKKKVPKPGEQVLCVWKCPTELYPYLYGVAVFNGSYWHDAEDDEDDFADPLMWQAIQPTEGKEGGQ